MTTLGWPDRATSPNAGLVNHVAHIGRGLALRLRGIGSAQTLARATWAVSIGGVLVVALLALRVWLQLAGETATGGLIGVGYSLSGVLASPFRSFEPTTPIQENGILEFSALVAIEAYLIATMVVLSVLFSARLALMAAPRVVHRHHLPAAGEQSLVVVPETTQP